MVTHSDGMKWPRWVCLIQCVLMFGECSLWMHANKKQWASNQAHMCLTGCCRVIEHLGQCHCSIYKYTTVCWHVHANMLLWSYDLANKIIPPTSQNVYSFKDQGKRALKFDNPLSVYAIWTRQCVFRLTSYSVLQLFLLESVVFKLPVWAMSCRNKKKGLRDCRQREYILVQLKN